MTVVDHLEKHLGLIEAAWSNDASDKGTSIKVVRLSGGPLQGRKVFATVGLSDHKLASRTSAKTIRQELILIVRGDFGDRNIPGLLQQVAREALQAHTAYLRGDVLGPRGALFDESLMEALYFAIPVYFSDSFASFRRDDGDTAVLVWLVPISPSEAHFVANNGWEAFEDELVKQDPDLTDPRRPPLALPAASEH
jgi:hypothetical protein